MGTGVLIGSFALAFTSQVLAQDDSANNLDDEDVEEITVTGSRIKRAGIDTFYPAISVGAAELEDGAFTNIADALNEIPAFGAPDASPFGAQNSFTVGQNFVDFLGLGSQRTLTLVNGRRFVSANSPSIFGTAGGLQVDYNVIPVALVERIETIGVGGAPIYGSDAIAGTINVILKDRYEGVQLSIRQGATSQGDGDIEEVSLVAGANFSDDRGNVTLSMEHFQQDGLAQHARPRYTANDPYWGSLEDHDGDPATARVRQVYRNQRINIFTNGGLIGTIGEPDSCVIGSLGNSCPIPSFGLGALPDGNFYQFDRDSNLVQFTPGDAPPGSFFFANGGDGPDFFDDVSQIQSPLERNVFTARMNYDLTDNVTFHSDVLFASTSSEELFNQGGFQTYAFSGTSSDLTFQADNPMMSQQARDLLLANGQTQFTLQRFNNDVIDSANFLDQFLWHASAGLEGDFEVGDRNFYWNMVSTHGESDGKIRSEGIIDDRFLNSINVRQLTAADLAAIDADPAVAEQALLGIGGTSGAGVGDVICESVYQVAIGTITGTSGNGVTDADLPFIQGCAPLNLFGENARSDVSREWVTADQIGSTKIQQSLFNMNFGGDLIELPGGWSAFNMGYETRQESAIFVPSAGQEVPLTRSSPFDETGGSYKTDEIYGELAIPLVSAAMDLPLLRYAELNGAFREIDNTLAGGQSVWTTGLRLSPISDLTFRANYTESVRAPSLVELFAPQAQVFNTANDPCDFRYVGSGPVPGTRAANCAADIAGYNPATFTSNIVNATAIGKSGGNPLLKNETAESYSIGLTYEPRWIDNLLFVADYINIELSDAIQSVGLAQLMNSCYDSTGFPNVTSCNSFVRDSVGQVVDFTTGQANAALFNYETMEYRVTYDFDVADLFGKFSDTWGGRDLGNFETHIRLSNQLERTTSVVGEATSETIGGYADPEWSGTFDFIWTGENARVFWRMLWQEDADLDPTGDNSYLNIDGNPIYKTDARFMNNVSFSYNVGSFFRGAPERTLVQLAVGNIFDREPDVYQEAAGHYGTSELLGRTFTFTIQANY